MQQQRSRVVWIIAIAVAFFFFIDPFRLFESNNIPTARVSNEFASEIQAFVQASPSAVDAVIDGLRTADLVMIGETGYISEHVTLVSDLIPRLDDAGIHMLLYQYANTEDQQQIDTLLSGITFDDEAARRILFNHLTVFGYQEHVEIFRAAWQVNRSKDPGQEPFRVIAISNRLNYEAVVNQDDVENPAVMRSVFASGITDQVMVRIISSEVFESERKAVSFSHVDHAFTDFEQAAYTEQLEELGFQGIRRAGNVLRSRYGGRVVTAALHGPARFARSRVGFAYPGSGIIDRAFTPDTGSTAGFVTEGSPFADVPITSDIVDANGLDALTLEQYADIYLMVGKLSDLTPVTAIDGFITEANFDDAVRFFPGPSPQDATVDEMNEFIAGNAQSIVRVLDEFK